MPDASYYQMVPSVIPCFFNIATENNTFVANFAAVSMAIFHVCVAYVQIVLLIPLRFPKMGLSKMVGLQWKKPIKNRVMTGWELRVPLGNHHIHNFQGAFQVPSSALSALGSNGRETWDHLGLACQYWDMHFNRFIHWGPGHIYIKQRTKPEMRFLGKKR